LFGKCFGYFSKNWAIFSKSSGHPAESVCCQSKADNVNERVTASIVILKNEKREKKFAFMTEKKTQKTCLNIVYTWYQV
jgi:hypothetical protein